MKAKEKTEARDVYEQSIRVTCEACTNKIKEARKIWLSKIRVARRERDDAIAEAKANFSQKGER